MAWHDEIASGNFVSLKVGETVEIEIKEIIKVESNPDFHPKRKDGASQGFHYNFITTDEKTLSLGTFALQSVMATAKIEVGDKIRVQHLEGQGNYTVEKIG